MESGISMETYTRSSMFTYNIIFIAQNQISKFSSNVIYLFWVVVIYTNITLLHTKLIVKLILKTNRFELGNVGQTCFIK